MTEQLLYSDYQNERVRLLSQLAAMSRDLREYRERDNANPKVVASREAVIQAMARFIEVADVTIDQMKALTAQRYAEGVERGRAAERREQAEEIEILLGPDHLREIHNRRQKEKWADHYDPSPAYFEKQDQKEALQNQQAFLAILSQLNRNL